MVIPRSDDRYSRMDERDKTQSELNGSSEEGEIQRATVEAERAKVKAREEPNYTSKHSMFSFVFPLFPSKQQITAMSPPARR